MLRSIKFKQIRKVRGLRDEILREENEERIINLLQELPRVEKLTVITGGSENYRCDISLYDGYLLSAKSFFLKTVALKAAMMEYYRHFLTQKVWLQ